MTKPSNADERLDATEALAETSATNAVAETSAATSDAAAANATVRRRERILAAGLGALLLATLVTSHGVSGALARYATGATSSDTARVALFGHSEKVELSGWVEGIKPGETRTIKLTVSNANATGAVSEVAQAYDIELETAHNLPLAFTLARDGGTGFISSVETTDSTGGFHTYTFTSDDMAFAPSAAEDTHTYTLTVRWPAGTNDDGYADIPDFVQASINVRQID